MRPAAKLPGLVGDDDVPHDLPGENPGLLGVMNMYNIPLDAVMGGAAPCTRRIVGVVVMFPSGLWCACGIAADGR